VIEMLNLVNILIESKDQRGNSNDKK
jgi:hypothetical protein